MTETRGITFRKLKENCKMREKEWDIKGKDWFFYCTDKIFYYFDDAPCTAANCPIWAKLKKEG